jgi:hypothetical protein
MNEPEGGAPPAAPVATPETPPPTPKGGGESQALLDKIERLQADLHQERNKLKSIATERDTLKATATQYEVEKKKRTALETALGTLGSDFTIDDTARQELAEVVNDLNDTPDLDARVLKMVNLAKKPVSSAPGLKAPFTRPATTTGGGTSTVPEKAANEYTLQELAVMFHEDPERYKEVRKERDNTTMIFGANKKG